MSEDEDEGPEPSAGTVHVTPSSAELHENIEPGIKHDTATATPQSETEDEDEDEY